jgi:uncharacterized repeat protein (TIGR01451 family)
MRMLRTIMICLAVAIIFVFVLSAVGFSVSADALTALGITPTPTLPSTATPTPPPGDDGDTPEPVIRKRGEPTVVLPGEEVVFTIEATNEGQEAVVGAVVIDEIPEYLEVLEVTTTQGTVHVEGQTVWVEVGTIGPGFVVEIVIRTRVRDDVPRPHVMENVAVMKSHNSRDVQTPPVVIRVPADGMPTTGGDAGVVWLVCVAAFLMLTAWVVWEDRRDPGRGSDSRERSVR